MLSENWIADAVEVLAGEAILLQRPTRRAPHRNLGKARTVTATTNGLLSPSDIQGAVATLQPEYPTPPEPVSRKGRKAIVTQLPAVEAPCDNLPPASFLTIPVMMSQAASELTGQEVREFHKGFAGQTHSDVSHRRAVTHFASADIGTLIEQHRYRWQMIRARQRLELQAQAVCRRFCDGDKVQAAKLWSAVKKDAGHKLRIWLEPFLHAMEPLNARQLETEKKLAKLAKQLPVYEWAKSVSGFGDVSLSAVIGELGAAPTDYKSVSAMWKRMGLAVIDGGRQRRVTGEAAIEHGYNAERRAIMWNIGACLLKAQVRKDPENEELRMSTGDYGALYLERKAYELARDIPKAQAHNRAQRYIEKRLLRELWRAWRDATKLPATNEISHPA